MKSLKNLLVVLPHAGLKIPPEIKKVQLSSNVDKLIDFENDWGTDLLYNFKKILGNKQITFRYNQIFINANRHPQILDDAAPVNLNGLEVYLSRPSIVFRKRLTKKYLLPFYKRIKKTKKTLLFVGHSFVYGRKDNAGKVIVDDIILNNLVYSKLISSKNLKSCSDELLRSYASALKKRLPNLRIGFNSAYQTVHDNILSDNLPGNNVRSTNAFIQETNEMLYMDGKKIKKKELKRLNRAFAEAIAETMNRFGL